MVYASTIHVSASERIIIAVGHTYQCPRMADQLLDTFSSRLFLRVMLGGLLPFAVIFIELFFILKSIWEDQYYYMFGILGLVFVILLITCVEISIIVIYFQLCDEVRLCLVLENLTIDLTAGLFSSLPLISLTADFLVALRVIIGLQLVVEKLLCVIVLGDLRLLVQYGVLYETAFDRRLCAGTELLHQ